MLQSLQVSNYRSLKVNIVNTTFKKQSESPSEIPSESPAGNNENDDVHLSLLVQNCATLSDNNYRK